MAAEDRILRLGEVIHGSGNLLTNYKYFESYDGVLLDRSLSNPYYSVYYPLDINNITNFTNVGLYPRICYGCALLSYKVQTGSPADPERYELLKQRDYNSGITMYTVSLHNPEDESGTHIDCKDASGNKINFKYEVWVGWDALYNSSGAASYYNPVKTATSLADVKATMINTYPNSLAQSYAFGHFYTRYSSSGVQNLTSNTGTTYSNYNWHHVFQGNYVVGGCRVNVTNSSYKGDGYNNITNYTSFIDLLVPGEIYNTEAPSAYYMYGYAATSKKLYPYSYIWLGNNTHSTKLTLTYIGDDSDYITSHGQNYNSASGFLNLGSTTQDKIDGLRYIYKCYEPFTRGFADNTSEWLNLYGILNNIVYITCACAVSCAPTGSTYTINMRYRYQILNSNNAVITTTAYFTHNILVPPTTGFYQTYYDASTRVVEEYPPYYKIKITLVLWKLSTSSSYKYLNCSLTRTVDNELGYANFCLITYDPPTMQNPY